MSTRCIGITHQDFDFDGGSCLRTLQQRGEIEEVQFGIEKVGEIVKQDRIEKIVFVDVSPREELSDIDIEVYDHHQSGKEEQITAFDLLFKDRNLGGLDAAKLQEWQKLVWLGDFRAEADNMDIHKALKRMHLLGEDQEIYTKWFVPLFDSFFVNEVDIQKAKNFFQEAILQFGLNNPQSPTKAILQRWSERLVEPEKLFVGSRRNLFRFISYMDEDIGKQWIALTLEGLNKEQTMFQQDKEIFKRTDIDFFGETLVISQVTSSPTFAKAARNIVYSKDEEAPALVREKIVNRMSPWIIIQVCPKTKNFQIFINGGMKIVQVICNELIKAIRAEILISREKKVPHWQELCQDGTIEDTDPLYFHKIEGGYSCILWGSLKRAAPPANVFGQSAFEIKTRLIEITKQAVDRRYFPTDCFPKNCRFCSMYSWQLKKCAIKRKSNALRR